jgi:hypothetical protein
MYQATGFHSFPVVDWFCLFIYLWVLTFPLEDCSEFCYYPYYPVIYKWKAISEHNFVETDFKDYNTMIAFVDLTPCTFSKTKNRKQPKQYIKQYTIKTMPCFSPNYSKHEFPFHCYPPIPHFIKISLSTECQSVS